MIERIDGHDPEAYYANGTWYPMIDCSCGFSTQGRNSWEAAGREFDNHMTAVKAESALTSYREKRK